MTKVRKKLKEHVVYHRDGSLWARGHQTADGVIAGYWEWFREDGTRMRSGYFEDGEQAGEWTTYDRKGGVVRVTQMKAKAVQKAAKQVLKKRNTKINVKQMPAKKKRAKK